VIDAVRKIAERIGSAATIPGSLRARYAWTALAAYVVLTAVVAVHHEPWRDEADPWLVARDADAVTFIRHASLGGTPELWYLMLVPLARSGAPYDAQKALHLIIATASVALILWRSPFPPLTKVAAAFSYYFAYEYAIIVRSYALSVLLLFAIATLQGRRFDKPLRYALAVALLANTNAHSLFIAAFLGMLFAYEAAQSQLLRSHWRAMAVMLLGGIVAAVQIGSDSADRAVSFVHIQFLAPLSTFGLAFLPMVNRGFTPILALVLTAAAMWWLRRDPPLLAFLCVSYAALVLILMFWWIGGLRHAGLFLVVLLMVIWIHLDRSRDRGAPAVTRGGRIVLALITLSLLVSDSSTAVVGLIDYRYAFSGAEEMAGFMNSHGLGMRPLAAHSETTTSAVAPYMKHPLWYAGIEEYGTFVRWDRKYDAGLDVPYPEAVKRVRRHFRGRSDVLLLLNVEIPNPAAEGLALVHTTPGPVFAHPDERFWLYRPDSR
jgi:hypothetical protein